MKYYSSGPSHLLNPQTCLDALVVFVLFLVLCGCLIGIVLSLISLWS